MASRDIRRHQRIASTVPVLLTWTSPDGTDRYARGRCRDISSAGLRLETVDTIPTQSYVNLRIENGIWQVRPGCAIPAGAAPAISSGWS